MGLLLFCLGLMLGGVLGATAVCLCVMGNSNRDYHPAPPEGLTPRLEADPRPVPSK
jgi:hypothetical protein